MILRIAINDEMSTWQHPSTLGAVLSARATAWDLLITHVLVVITPSITSVHSFKAAINRNAILVECYILHNQ